MNGIEGIIKETIENPTLFDPLNIYKQIYILYYLSLKFYGVQLYGFY
jgi:hypothetical protein